MNMNFGFFDRQIPRRREGARQIRVTAEVVFRPLPTEGSSVLILLHITTVARDCRLDVKQIEAVRFDGRDHD